MSNEKKTKKPSRLSKNTLKTAKRLLKYVTETYKLRFVLVFAVSYTHLTLPTKRIV